MRLGAAEASLAWVKGRNRDVGGDEKRRQSREGGTPEEIEMEG